MKTEKMLDELTRDQLLHILNAVGGSGAALDQVDDLTLAAILTNRIAAVTDAGALDRALHKSLTFEWRAALMARKIELDQLARAATLRKAAAFSGMAVFVPKQMESMTHFVDVNGVSRAVRIVDGRRVLDLTPAEYMRFLTGPHGLDWQRANEGNAALELMQPGLHF